MKNETSEFQRFDKVMNKLLAVSHKELKAREHKYKLARIKKKRAKF